MKKIVQTITLFLSIAMITACAGQREIKADAETGSEVMELQAETEEAKEETAEEKAEPETEEEPEPETEPESGTEPETEEETEPEELIIPEKDEIVRVQTYIPDIMTELRYATNDNFTGEVIYDFTDAYLRYGTIEKLAAVQEKVKEDGYSLKIWDAFRPVSAQFTLWDVYPDGAYVANPNKGYSSHSRGNTVDITLVNADGSLIPMPTDLDDFSAKADRDYSDCSEEEAANAKYLENVMSENGFTPYSAEWWHFSDNDRYDVASGFEIPPAGAADKE